MANGRKRPNSQCQDPQTAHAIFTIFPRSAAILLSRITRTVQQLHHTVRKATAVNAVAVIVPIKLKQDSEIRYFIDQSAAIVPNLNSNKGS